MAKIKNCLGCGRDTKSISGYCRRCTGDSRYPNTCTQMPSEAKDRPAFHIGSEHLFGMGQSNEDNYSEEAMASSSQCDDDYWSAKDHDRHFNEMRKSILAQ